MKVYKFGGASVRNAASVKNVVRVLRNHGCDACLMVISAMGKTTNALENVVDSYFADRDFDELLLSIHRWHLSLMEELFAADHKIFGEVDAVFAGAKAFLDNNASRDYNFVYDQIISIGELLSSKIVSAYLQLSGMDNMWLDARDFIKTSAVYREGEVDWDLTKARIAELNTDAFYTTQGFIASDANGYSVTLGREGSDYSAAIFAYCLNAEYMTIWKDVPGVMTGDPNKFPDAVLIDSLSYEEAIEMAYYGASVIHPKTLQPLKQKEIPFFVKSFVQDNKPGTKICKDSAPLQREVYILKEKQHLLRVSTRDFSFIAEDHLSFIFGELSRQKIKITLMQNSAISLALCLEDKFGNIEKLVTALQAKFKTEHMADVSLFTVRHVQSVNTEKYYKGRNVLIEQIAASTLQMVIQ